MSPRGPSPQPPPRSPALTAAPAAVYPAALPRLVRDPRAIPISLPTAADLRTDPHLGAQPTNRLGDVVAAARRPPRPLASLRSGRRIRNLAPARCARDARARRARRWEVRVAARSRSVHGSIFYSVRSMISSSTSSTSISMTTGFLAAETTSGTLKSMSRHQPHHALQIVQT